MSEAARAGETAEAAAGGGLRRIGAGGLGRPDAPEAAALAWHEGRLYLGTSGPALAIPTGGVRVMAWSPGAAGDGGEGAWETLFETPALPGLAGGAAPGEGAQADAGGGVRAFALFEGETDPGPCLYAGGMARRGPVLLRSEDGRAFAALPSPAAGPLGAPPGFGSLAVHAGRLFAAAGPSAAPGSGIQASADPRAGIWQPAGPEGATGPALLACAHGALYAALTDPERGFSLWRTASAQAPFEWEPVIERGAGRHAQSPAVLCAAVMDDALYLGTGPAGGMGETDGAELIRVHADGGWDLLCGRLRLSPEGLRVPLSGLGPGLGRRTAIGIASLAAHAGLLWACTLDTEVADRLDAGEAPSGGFRLLASADGEAWVDAGQGRPAQIAGSALCPTPHGLALSAQDASAMLSEAIGAMPPDETGFEVWLTG